MSNPCKAPPLSLPFPLRVPYRTNECAAASRGTSDCAGYLTHAEPRAAQEAGLGALGVRAAARRRLALRRHAFDGCPPPTY